MSLDIIKPLHYTRVSLKIVKELVVKHIEQETGRSVSAIHVEPLLRDSTDDETMMIVQLEHDSPKG